MENDTSSGNGTGLIDRSLFVCFPPVASWARNTELLVLAVVFMIGVPGNFILVLVQAKNKKKSSTDYLVMTIASYEFVCCILNIPIQLLRNLPEVWAALGSTALCRFKLFASNYTSLASSLLLAAIAVDRYIKTCKPLYTQYGEQQSKYICIGVAILALALSSPYTTFSYWNPVASNCCLYAKPVLGMKTWGTVLSCVFMMLLCIISVSYFNIVISLKRRLADKVRRRTANTSKQLEVKPENKYQPSDVTTESEYVTEETAETSYCNESSSVSVNDVSVVENKATGTTVTTKSKEAHGNKQLLMEGKNLNRLTITMLLISLIYISTGLLNWVLFFLGPFVLGIEALFLSFSLLTLNCISNPILFFAMSGRFRENTKKVLCGK